MSGNCRASSMDSWVHKDENAPGISKNMRRNIIYFRKMVQATPSWADQKKIAAIYRECKRLRKAGFNVVVDHIVPLNHQYVQGLHWEGNLQIISYEENEAKSNHYWPDMWADQMELIAFDKVEQYDLSL